MNMYESVVILNADMSTKETKDEIAKYTAMLQAWCGTKKVKVEDMGVRKLAYPIRKTHTTGYYVLFTFMAHPAHITDLERAFRIDDNILKFITVRREEAELEDYIPNDEKEEAETQSEQQPDALDVLLGFAEYKKKGVKKNGTNNTKRCHSKT